ncbi:hypothetical protein LBMAG27_03080 [Bacteroidota bacterium]|nr:hypothetical protein LBMAG27_03080 [Bacteroidota bacterium]
MKIKIESIVITNAISSASGLAVAGNIIWMVGDDADYVTKSTIGQTDFRRIKLCENASEERLAKATKHDFEACTIGEIAGKQYLFVLGSGGLSPYRESMFALNIENTEQCYKRSLQHLYNAIRSSAGLKEKELNIEGAAVAGDKLVLFNRGKNFIVLLSWKKFSSFALHEDATDIPPFKIIMIELPMVNGFQIGFSGACTINENELLFTATLEETHDPIADGAIKGSYIGLLNLQGNDFAQVVSLTQMKNNDNHFVTDKLEAIEIIKIKGKNMSAIAVADNDDGSSKLYYLSICID